SLVLPLCAAEKPAADDASDARTTAAAPATSASEIEQLKKMLQDQQRQIDELRRALLDRDKGPDRNNKAESSRTATAEPVVVHASTGEVASTTAVLPPSSAPAPLPTYFPSAVSTPTPQAGASS